MVRNANFDQAADKEVLLSIYRNLLFPSCDSIFFLYTNGKIFDANQRGIELLGYTLEELCGLNITDLITPGNLNERPLQMPLLQNNQMFVEERNLRRKDGGVIQVEIRAQKLQEEVVLGILQDVTAQKEKQEIFRQMEDRYRLIVETATEGICTMDENNLITYVNTRLADMLGSSEEEMVGKTMTPFLHDEDLPHYWALMASRQQGNADSVERRFRRKDGSILWVNISPKPVMDEQGVYRGQFAMFTDITKEKQNDEIQKARLRILQFADSHSLDQLLKETLDILGELSGSPIGFFHFLAKDQVTFTRRAWSTQTTQHFGEHAGYTNHQPYDQMGIWMDCINNRRPVIINDFVSLVHTKNLPSGHGAIARFLIIPVVRGEKVSAIIGIGDKASNYDQGDIDLVTSFAGLVWDIAERKIAEEKLRQNSIQYQAIINTSLDGFSMCSTAGKILEANDAYCRMLGYTRDEILKLSILDIEAKEMPKETARHIKSMAENGSERFETRHKCKDGKIIDVEVNTTYMPDVGIFTTFTRDITERKQAELQREAALITIQKSEEMLKETQQIASVGRWELNLTNNYLTWSETIFEIFEIDSTQFGESYETFLESIHPDDRHMVNLAYTESLKNKTPYEITHRLLMKDGRIKWVNEICHTEYDIYGKAIKSIGIIQDITTRILAEEELIKRERLLQESQETAHVGSYIIDLEKGTNLWTKETYHIFGMDENEPVPTIEEYRSFIHPDDVALLYEKFGKSISSGSEFNLVYRIIHKNGSIHFVHSIGIPEKNIDNVVVRMVGTFQDVTEIKQAEEVLTREKQRLANIIKGTNVGTWELNVQTGKTTFNDHWAEMIGYTVEELSPTTYNTWSMLVHPDDFERSRELEEKHFRGESDFYESEVRMRHKNGSWVWVLTRGKVIAWTEDGKPLLMYGTHQDITEKKLAEEELIKREGLLEESQKIAHLGSYIYEVDAKKTYWTKEIYRIFALDENSPALRGVDFERFIHPDDLEKEKEVFNGCIQTATKFDWTYRIIAHDGVIRFVRSIGYPECDENGRLKRFTGTIQDITESKVLEINLQTSLAEKEVLLREVHHRVKNNLAAILGLLDMERQSTTDQSAEKLLTELSNRIKSMSTVHEKLYRSESLSKIDFQDYLKSFISHLRTSFRTTGDVISTIDAAGIELSLDLAVPCGLIVNELVTNSMKYAFTEGKPGDQCENECKVMVSMKEEGGRYTLSVGDNGRGLPIELDWRETRSLGLRLVRMLGEHQLGGTVDLDNTFGAHFTIQFDTLSGEK